MWFLWEQKTAWLENIDVFTGLQSICDNDSFSVKAPREQNHNSGINPWKVYKILEGFHPHLSEERK